MKRKDLVKQLLEKTEEVSRESKSGPDVKTNNSCEICGAIFDEVINLKLHTKQEHQKGNLLVCRTFKKKEN